MSWIGRILVGVSSRGLPKSWHPNATGMLSFKHNGLFVRSESSGGSGVEKRQITEAEAKLIGLLQARFPKARHIDVVDISGGCGAMYTVYVETSEFRNMRTVKQHQMVNDVLLAEIKNNMHGLRIQTAVPPPSDEEVAGGKYD